MMFGMSGSVEASVRRVLDAVGVTGFVHARAIDDAREVALDADAPVVMASVFQVAVCLELYRQAAVAQVDLAERHLVPVASRSPGPGRAADDGARRRAVTGGPGYLMMAVSDNAATDVIIARVGLERINATLRSLGLERTVVATDCAGIGQAIMDAVGASNPDDLPPAAGLPGAGPAHGHPDVPARDDLAAGDDLAWRGRAGRLPQRGELVDGPAVLPRPHGRGVPVPTLGRGQERQRAPTWPTRPGW